jgi:hypothetical protein
MEAARNTPNGAARILRTPVASNAELPFGRLIFQSTILNRRLDMKKTLIVGAALALAPIFALAADDTKKGAAHPSTSSSMSQDSQFQALDKNKDGYLSQDELKGHSNMPSFSTLDKDGDGKISAQEWSDHQKGAAGAAGPAGTPGAAGSSMAPPSSSSPSTGTPSPASPSTSSPSTSPSTGGTKK